MKNQNTDTAYFTPILFILLIFMSAGWYFAESDNEILLQELKTQGYSQHVHKQQEDKQHD